jgi:hypothetical protein
MHQAGQPARKNAAGQKQRHFATSGSLNVDLAELTLDTTGDRPRSGASAPGTNLRWLTRDATRGELAPAYSPDGSRIAYFSNRRGAEPETIWTMASDGSNATPLTEDGRVSVYPRWTGDGQSLIFMSRMGANQSELRRVPFAGMKPEILESSERFAVPWGDIASDGRMAYSDNTGKAHILDLKSRQEREIEQVHGTHLRWSHDGDLLAFKVPARRGDDREAGAWVYDFRNPARQVFQGWVLWQEWMHSGDLLVAQGQPDLTARLWRVHLDGSAPTRSIILPTYFSYYVQTNWQLMFDVHPDGRRIVTPMLESHEADIGMIESVQ